MHKPPPSALLVDIPQYYRKGSRGFCMITNKNTAPQKQDMTTCLYLTFFIVGDVVRKRRGGVLLLLAILLLLLPLLLLHL